MFPPLMASRLPYGWVAERISEAHLRMEDEIYLSPVTNWREKILEDLVRSMKCLD